MAAEAVSSRAFQSAFDGLREDDQWDVDFAIYAIESDPSWGPDRYLAPASSPYTGFIIDLSVSGFGIVYRIVDRGAAVELWYLFKIPEPPERARAGPVPMM